jgi:hypothetical protein
LPEGKRPPPPATPSYKVEKTGDKIFILHVFDFFYLLLVFPMFFLPNRSVAGVRERLPKADIAAYLRRRGCVGDAALRGSDQGEPPQAVPPPEAIRGDENISMPQDFPCPPSITIVYSNSVHGSGFAIVIESIFA